MLTLFIVVVVFGVILGAVKLDPDVRRWVVALGGLAIFFCVLNVFGLYQLPLHLR